VKLLVLAPEAIGPAQVRAALGDEAEGAEVRVVAPAVNQSSLAFWVSDPDEAIAEADTAQRETVDALREEGADASGDTGESEPLVAIGDALATFAADRILIFVREGDEQGYREEELGEAERRFGVPVTVAAL